MNRPRNNQELTELAESTKQLSNRFLIAFWNVLNKGKQVSEGTNEQDLAEKSAAVKEELNRREIQFTDGQLIHKRSR